MTYSPLTTRIRATSKYSSRQGYSVQRFIIHHCAGTSNDGNESMLADDFGGHSSNVSANYLLRSDGQLVSIVPEEYRAWTTGWDADKNSVTVETVNIGGDPDWPVSDEQIETLAQMAADLSTRYGWGPLTRDNVKFHREFLATACPGNFIYARADYIVARANEILAGPPAPPERKAPMSIVMAVSVKSGVGNSQPGAVLVQFEPGCPFYWVRSPEELGALRAAYEFDILDQSTLDVKESRATAPFGVSTDWAKLAPSTHGPKVSLGDVNVPSDPAVVQALDQLAAAIQGLPGKIATAVLDASAARLKA